MWLLAQLGQSKIASQSLNLMLGKPVPQKVNSVIPRPNRHRPPHATLVGAAAIPARVEELPVAVNGERFAARCKYQQAFM